MAEEFPLKIIHYKVADYGGEGYDTGIKVTKKDLEEAAIAADVGSAPAVFHPHLIADALKTKFHSAIKAVVELDPYVKEYCPDNWAIQDGELGEAIRNIAKLEVN